MTDEKKRQLAHILLLIFALFLKYLSRWQVILLLLILLGVVVAIVPKLKIKKHFYRRQETVIKNGAVFYILILIVLALIFPLPVVAASWAILALGDGMATLVGRSYQGSLLPWSKSKTYMGSLAFIFFGALGAWLLLKWSMPELSLAMAAAAGLKAALVAAIIESLPGPINDNITVAVSAALTLAFII